MPNQQENYIKEIEDFIRRKKEDISLNKGTWMNDMEKYYEGTEDVVKDLEKLLNKKSEYQKMEEMMEEKDRILEKEIDNAHFEMYNSESEEKETICRACKKDFLVPSKGSFGYCPDCGEDMERADLHLAIKNHIPKDWRIGQFVFNFLEWLAQKEYAPYHGARMADPFHLSDEEFVKYWFMFLRTIK